MDPPLDSSSSTEAAATEAAESVGGDFSSAGADKETGAPLSSAHQRQLETSHSRGDAAVNNDTYTVGGGKSSAISYTARSGSGASCRLARQFVDCDMEGTGGCSLAAAGYDEAQNARESGSKKGFKRKDGQMRRSQPIEQPPEPETDKRLQSGSRRLVAERGDCLSGSLNLERQSIKSASRELASRDTSSSNTASFHPAPEQPQPPTTCKANSELAVEWLTDADREGLVKRPIRASIDSRSLCIRTSLVKSPSPSNKNRRSPREAISGTIRCFVDRFKRPKSRAHSNDQDHLNLHSELQSSGAADQVIDGEDSYREEGGGCSSTKERLLPVCHDRARPGTVRNKSRDYIQISLSCNQMHEPKVVSSSRSSEQTFEGRADPNQLSHTTRALAKSSNYIPSTRVNMSSNADRKYVAKNKYLSEDKLRKQVQTRASARIDHKNRTYHLPAGATDINNDSSSSPTSSLSNNCYRDSNSSAMIRRCLEDDSKEELDDDSEEGSKAPPKGVECRISISNKNTSSGLKKRENWDKNIEFLLAVIGFAVDLGNVWRFPYICYKNGGGAFLVPYTIMFILGGLPIFYLEMSLGQYFSSGCLTVWKRVCPMAKGIGYAMCVLNFFTGLYYNTIISWAVFFFVESFTQTLPWTSCNNPWNGPDCRTIDQRQAVRTNNEYSPATSNTTEVYYSSPTKDYFEREVLQIHLSSGIDDLGSIRKPLAIYLAIVFICIYFAIWKGVKSTGKAVWITALLPYFVLIPLLFRGVFLEGAWLGIKYYLYPQWVKITNVDVWVEAAKQIYFSLGPGFGTLMALSSYNRFNHDCCRDTLIAASVNYFASFISGLVIFAVLGYMATIENVNISDVAAEGPGLVFQVYPEGLATMRYSSMWSVLFFIMVITLGIDSTFGGLESVITGLCDEYPRILRAHRSTFIGILIVLIYLCSLPTTTYGGNYVIFVLEQYGTSLSLLFIVLVETIIVCWLYGADRFCKNLEEMHGKRPGAYWRICWKYISPTILLLIFIAACLQELDKYHTLSNGKYTYPKWAPTVGLLMTGSSVCCIPVYAIYYIKTKTSGSFRERLKIASRPIEGDLRDEKEIYVDALTDKIREENKGHRDTVI